MPIKKRDFVELDYTGCIKDTKELFDTTNEKIAQDAKIFSSRAEYKPIVICVGEAHILPGIDEFIEGKELGTYTVSLTTEHAFGKKDPSLMKIIPTSKFAEQNIKPIPNLRLNIDGMIGLVKSVSSGRTVVDFNHPLAGKDVVYELQLYKLVTDKKTQIASVLKVLLGMHNPEIKMEENRATITIPEIPQPLLADLAKKLKELSGIDITFEHPKSTETHHDHTHEHHDHDQAHHDNHAHEHHERQPPQEKKTEKQAKLNK